MDETGSRRWRSAPVFASGHRPAPQKSAKRKRTLWPHSREGWGVANFLHLHLPLPCGRVSGDVSSHPILSPHPCSLTYFSSGGCPGTPVSPHPVPQVCVHPAGRFVLPSLRANPCFPIPVSRIALWPGPVSPGPLVSPNLIPHPRSCFQGRGSLFKWKVPFPLDNGGGGVLCLQSKELCSLTETGKFAFPCVEYHHMRTEHLSKPTVWAALRGIAAQCCPFCLSAKENML